MLLVNNRPIDYFKFSGGEIQVRLGEIPEERAILTWKPTEAEDILLLLLSVNALQHKGFRDIELEVLYLPYARQDRVCAPGEAFSLEVIIKILDGLGISDIRFWDLHNSDYTLDGFKETCVHETEIEHIFARYKLLDDFDVYNLVLCAPDRGARAKVDAIVKEFDLMDGIHFEKKRNPNTGIIEGISPCKYNHAIDGHNVLVVDDICDGGRTFIEIAKELRQGTSDNLYLYVTHGIFSKGLEELLSYYKHIFCHHVLHNDYESTDRLTILREFKHDV